MRRSELKDYLDFKSEQYNARKFIESDPIQLPHRFTRKEDVEIVALLVATIAWGQRKSIIQSGERMLEIMEYTPYEFILNYDGFDHSFVHRTFNRIDLDFFFRSLKRIYTNGGLEKSFSKKPNIEGIKGRIVHFRDVFLSEVHEPRSEKHISNPMSNSAAKRINMFLRWMVRTDRNGVDFGIWKSIPPSELYIPLDVHTGNTARSLGLIQRKQNDWRALEELMQILIEFDSEDPAKYDFALFGIGAFEGKLPEQIRGK